VSKKFGFFACFSRPKVSVKLLLKKSTQRTAATRNELEDDKWIRAFSLYHVEQSFLLLSSPPRFQLQLIVSNRDCCWRIFIEGLNKHDDLFLFLPSTHGKKVILISSISYLFTSTI
jgi:hypothetical protein